MGKVNELKDFTRGQLDAALMKIGHDAGVGTAAGIRAFLANELTISKPICAKQVAARSKKIRSKYLKLISGGRQLELDAVDGTKIIADAKDMFPAGIDSDFRNWKADEPGQPTGKTFVDVYEMKQDATFERMFKSLDADFGRLCLTQHQILDFIKKHKNWLRKDGYGTFFPFKSYRERFVARVVVSSDGLFVVVYRFGRSYVWHADLRLRVVVPQLA